MVDPTGLYEICADDQDYGHVCFDSTEVGLPSDPPVGAVEGYCLFGGGEVFFCDGSAGIGQYGVWEVSDEFVVIAPFLAGGGFVGGGNQAFNCRAGIFFESPCGGGGGTQPKPLAGPKVTFGHGARHLEGTGLTRTQVESAITARVNEIWSNPMTLGTGNWWGWIEINGVTVQYRAFTRPGGVVHVGTYYVP
jgi:hypothetical protein